MNLKDAVNLLQDECHNASKAGGWWNEYQTLSNDMKKLWVGTKLVLVHSEVSEALEAYRKSLPDEKLKHRPGIEVELADAVIRIADLAGGLGLDLGGALVEKMAYNAVRADHKPEARAAAGGKAF